MTDTLPQNLCQFEIDVLKAFRDGQADDLPFGAATNAATETLAAAGFLTRFGAITPQGRFFLATREEENT